MIKHVELINKEGKTLRGYLHKPENCNGEIVVMFHGFTGNKTEHQCHFRNFSRILEKERVSSIRLDFSGNGESDGTFLDFTFDTLLSDAQLIIEYVLKLEWVKKVNLLGFSMGGAVAAMMAAKYNNKINKLLLWSPARNILSIIKNSYEVNKKDEFGNTLRGSFSMSKAMYDSISKYDVMSGLSLYNGKVFIVHGDKDLAVPFENSYKYLEVFAHVFLHCVEGSGHGYDENIHMEELYEVSRKFIIE